MLPTLAASLALFVRQTPDPAALVKSLRAVERSAENRARNGEAVDMAAVEADVRSKAAVAVVGIDPATLPAEGAGDWSALYRLAGRKDEARTLSEKALAYHSMRAWEEQQTLLADYIERGDKPKILDTLAYIQGTSVPMVGQLGEAVVYGLTGKYGESDPAFVLRAYDVLLRRFDLKRPMAPDQLSWTRFALAHIGANRDALLYKTGHRAEALADLKRVANLVAGDKRAADAVVEVESRLSVTGKPAPEIVTTRHIGAYNGLAALRGKVVLVDFFAHWCGPCKRSFPELRTLYAQNRAKGLEVVGVTELYGYYGAQQGLKADAEFALMRDRFVPQFGLPWPVVFEKGSAASAAYGVSVIPQMAVVDRTGTIRRIVVGYTPDEFAQTKTLVARLLAEPVPTAAK